MDADYPRLWRQMTAVRQAAGKYGPSAKRHLRLAMLHLAAGTYDRAARESCLGLALGHELTEAHHTRALALLGQAMVAAGHLEPGPAMRRKPLASVRWLCQAAAETLGRYIAKAPTDAEAVQLHSAMQGCLALDDQELAAALPSVVRPAGPSHRGPSGPCP